MSRQYYDDPYRPSGHRVIIQPNQLSDSSSRRDAPSNLRNSTFQSTFQPNQQRTTPTHYDHYYREEYPQFDEYPNSTRSVSNRTNNSSNDKPHRRYRLEEPSTRTHVQYPQSYHNGNQNVSRSSDRHHVKSQQPSSNYSSASQPVRYDQNYPNYERNSNQHDRRHHREETYPVESYPLQSNRRSVNVPSTRQYSNPIRSSDHSSSFAHTLPVRQSSQSLMPMQRHHPASLLSHILQSVFGGHSPSFNDDDDDDDDHLPSAPINLIALGWMMQRPDMLTMPIAVHVQFGNLFDLLGHDEQPSVGLSDSDIERIPTMTYRKTSKSKSTDDKCTICLSQYKNGETVKYLRCKHFFHPECIDPWLKTSTQCPICRGAQTD